jgi:hypothetical protein
MKLIPPLLAACLIATAAFAPPALAQGVEVAPLTAPDVFSGGARDTGLGAGLWKGSSAELARRVMPTIGTKPLSPAAKSLAVRLLSTGANAPDGAAEDRALAAARGRALLSLGERAAANASVERIPNLAAEPALAEVAAETALLMEDPERACRIEQGVTVGRGEAYWLRLRAFCQAIAGQTEAAQLTLTLAQEKAKDPTFARLMGALLLGGDPGESSVRTGLEKALSIQLRLAPPVIITPRPPVPTPEMLAADPIRAGRLYLQAGDLAAARALRASLTQDVIPGAKPHDIDLLDAAIAADTNENLAAVQDALVQRGVVGNPLARTASLYLAALGAPMDGEARDAFAAFAADKSLVPPARLFALDTAAQAGLKGETGLLVVWIASEAGSLSSADRAFVIRALNEAGLTQDARAFAVEGILALSPK